MKHQPNYDILDRNADNSCDFWYLFVTLYDDYRIDRITDQSVFVCCFFVLWDNWALMDSSKYGSCDRSSNTFYSILFFRLLFGMKSLSSCQ